MVSLLKVKAKLALKDGEQLHEDVLIDVPKEYVNRGMQEYVENWLFEALKGKVRAVFEVVE